MSTQPDNDDEIVELANRVEFVLQELVAKIEDLDGKNYHDHRAVCLALVKGIWDIMSATKRNPNLRAVDPQSEPEGSHDHRRDLDRLDISDRLNAVISILHGWAAVASSDGFAAIGRMERGGDAVYYSLQHVIRCVSEIQSDIEGSPIEE
ncbi:MAG: hypothetical protein HYX63_01670 [Gammaproteobacteria bacterium]|nr:hypothetical protein [Gammaproteobacteria bacterium]